MTVTATRVGAGPRPAPSTGFLCRRCGKHISTKAQRGNRYCVDCKSVMRDLGDQP